MVMSKEEYPSQCEDTETLGGWRIRSLNICQDRQAYKIQSTI